MLQVVVEPFDRSRPRNQFESGRKPIDAWYKNHAKKSVDRAEFRVFEAVTDQQRNLVGYYALQLGSESLSEFRNQPDDYTKNYVAFPAVHLAYLGVDKGAQRQGIGRALLSDAFKKAYKISRSAGFYAMTLQSYDEASTAFYQSLGFTRYAGPTGSPKMLMPIRTIIDLVEQS